MNSALRISVPPLGLRSVLQRAIFFTVGVAATYVLLWNVHLLAKTWYPVSENLFFNALDLVRVGIPLVCVLTAGWFLTLRIYFRHAIARGDWILMVSIALVLLTQFKDVFMLFVHNTVRASVVVVLTIFSILLAFQLERFRVFPTPWVRLFIVYAFAAPLLFNLVGIILFTFLM